MASAVLDVALEVCDVGDDSDTTIGRGEDVWDTVLSLTENTLPNKKRRDSLEEALNWDQYNKHQALLNLLGIAVSHNALPVRKAYIQRIMTCSSTTQRILMALIERHKRANRKTPSKPRSSAKKRQSSAKKPRGYESTTTPSKSSMKSSTGTPSSTKSGYSGSANKAPSFQERRNMYESKTPGSQGPSSKGRSPMKMATPNFLRRVTEQKTGEISRRDIHQSYSSPMPVSSAKRSLPPSSEQVRRGGTGMFSPGLGDTAEYESQVQNLREENQELSRNLQRSQARENDLSDRVDEMESKFRQDMLKVEREARDRVDRSKGDHQQQVQNLQQELAAMSGDFSRVQNERDELAKLKDEMEVMTHTKSQLEETTERLRTYKEKVQQFADVKEALQREEEAHSRSVEENLRLKNDLQNLAPVKRQLEEYKEKAVDLEVQLTDCQDELKRFKEKKSSSSDINHQMEEYVLAQEEEIQELRRRVQQNDVAENESSGVGDGMSELNPELKAEVLSLRNENLQLRSFAKKRDGDEVSKLEQEVEDKTMLAERYKTQFLSTKNQLEDTVISLEESKDREMKLQQEVEEKTRVGERFKSQYLNTKEQLESTQMSLQESKTREGKLRGELADSFSKVKETQQEVDEVSNQLIKANEEINAGLGRESKLEQELTVWTGEAKSAQEQSNDLSHQLKKSHTELAESHNRESTLLEQVAQCKGDIESMEDNLKDLSEELQQRTADLEQSQGRESALEKSVTEWTTRAEESHEHAKDVSSQLMKCQEELEGYKDTIAKLEATLLEEGALKQELENEVTTKQEELDRTTKTLEETFASLQANKEKAATFQNEISDLMCRIEDAESISKQRMDLVQTTREKAQSLEEAVQALEQEKAELITERTSLTETKHELQQSTEDLEGELEEIRRSLNDTEEKLSESQALCDHLKTDAEASTVQNEDLTGKLTDAENLRTRLQDELVETRDVLNTKQQELKSIEERENLANEKLEQKEQMILELENSLEKEIEARKEVLGKLEMSIAGHQELQEESEQKEVDLTAQLVSERKEATKLKQELKSLKEDLDAKQVNLGSSNHREKMLKHEIAKLEDKLSEKERELADAKNEFEVSLQDSSETLDSLRKKLAEKAQAELAEVQNNMNELLDAERAAKRQQEVSYQEQISHLTDKYENEMGILKLDSEEILENSKQEFELKLEAVKDEYEQLRVSLEKEAEDERTKLMEKGKGMIKDIKEKLEKEKSDLDDDVEYLTQKVMKEEEDKKRLGIQFQTKIVEYKKKLQNATGRITMLSEENSDFEESVKRLERDRNKLREENERYRRQIGGRSGADSALQNQMELLQKEFQNAVDENRELKRRLQSNGQSTLPSIGEDTGSGRYTRSRTNQQSTLVQLRSEYEETIESLNDEKRELVMKNSAALTDVKKAERRAWQVEQENAKLKQDLTSLKLSNERLEGQLSSVEEDSENAGHASTYSNISISEMSPIPQPPSDLGESFSNEDRVLSTNRDHGNVSFASSATDKYSSAGRGGFTSPDLETKRWVQSASLHTPYRSRKTTNDPPDGKEY
ncbi:MAG: hypothetical protein SGILL_003407 [Bacillariaceae sp.]